MWMLHALGVERPQGNLLDKAGEVPHIPSIEPLHNSAPQT